MKKKLLSLVLAGAMVATTSVSAFATPNVVGSDAEDKTIDVNIKGEVLGEQGEKPAGNFSVTVPTAASFTVKKGSNSILSAPITIENSGTQDIDVYADKFVDLSREAGKGITVVNEAGTKGNNRTYVTLNLEGDENVAYFKTETDESKSGIYKKSTLEEADEVSTTDGLKLTNIQKSQSKKLTLSGVVGDSTNGLDKPVSNNFTLTLRIKKSTKQS